MNPSAQADMITALNDAANEVNGMKNDFAALQTRVDSLQEVVAAQDSTIARLASFVGMPTGR